jgi:hypothetical protein
LDYGALAPLFLVEWLQKENGAKAPQSREG